MTPQKTTVIYHSADFDGIFCREISRKFLPHAELIGWNFGDPLIEFPSGQVFILDLSPECIMASSVVEGWEGRLIWIDHHKSSIERWAKDIPGYRIDGVAACRMAWQWFKHWVPDLNGGKGGINGFWERPEKEVFIRRGIIEPWSVRLAGEYDIWDKRDSDAELFQHGLRSEELTAHTWKGLFDSKGMSGPVIRLLEQGKVLQYSKRQENERTIKTAGFDMDFEGLHFLACNHSPGYNSLLFTAGLKPEHDAVLGFGWKKGGWTVSLYHAPGKEHHDLSLIAVKHGGGGHRGACGFNCKSLPFTL